MYNGAHVGTQFVDFQVHGDLGGAFAPAGNLVAARTHHDQIVGLHHALRDAGRSGEYPFGVEPDADIPIVGGHPPLLEHQPADFDNVLAILALRLHHAGVSIVSNGGKRRRFGRLDSSGGGHPAARQWANLNPIRITTYPAMLSNGR